MQEANINDSDGLLGPHHQMAVSGKNHLVRSFDAKQFSDV